MISSKESQSRPAAYWATQTATLSRRSSALLVTRTELRKCSLTFVISEIGIDGVAGMIRHRKPPLPQAHRLSAVRPLHKATWLAHPLAKATSLVRPQVKAT